MPASPDDRSATPDTLAHPWPHRLRIATLKRGAPNRFDLRADQAERTAIAVFLGLEGLTELRFKGELVAKGAEDWVLNARLTGDLTQACVATLEPVPLRINTQVSRHFVPQEAANTIDIDPEADDDPDEFGAEIDPGTVALEELALALPLYPRADDAALIETSAAPPGVIPLDEDAMKPFAGLAGLKDKLQSNS